MTCKFFTNCPHKHNILCNIRSEDCTHFQEQNVVPFTYSFRKYQEQNLLLFIKMRSELNLQTTTKDVILYFPFHRSKTHRIIDFSQDIGYTTTEFHEINNIYQSCLVITPHAQRYLIPTIDNDIF